MTTPGSELPARVAAEIHLLRKGRGLQASDLDSRLRKLLLMDELAGPGDAAAHRHALIAEVSRCSAELLGDYRTAIEASLALSAETKQEPLFGGRVNWLAAQLDRDYRTALRRIDEAEGRLAEVIATELRRRRSRTAVAPDGWYVRELRTLLRLDTEIMESREDRRIVSTRENLTQVKAWLDVPRDANQPGADLQAEILYGGRLLRQEQSARNRFDFMVQLPKPLQPGEEHEYGLLLHMPRSMLRSSHYLLTPECQFNRFDLRIRFDLNRLPGWVRRVDRETVRMFEGAEPAGDLLAPDAAGEVHEEFLDLAMYLGYGIQWQPAA
jgi:hypothetical protein